MRYGITILALAGMLAASTANAEAVLLVNEDNEVGSIEERALLKNGHEVTFDKRALPNAAASPEEVFMNGQAFTDTDETGPATPAFKMNQLSQQITGISESVGNALSQKSVEGDQIEEMMCPFVKHVANSASTLINGVTPSSDKPTRDAAATLGQVVWSLYNATENLNLTCDGLDTMSNIIDKLQTNLDVEAVAAAARKKK